MAVRIIQTFIRVCQDCPHCHYYSGGMYECGLTDERFTAERKQAKVGDHCPLPFAGPPAAPATEMAPWPAEAAPDR